MTSFQQEFLKINSCVNMATLAGQDTSCSGLWCINPPSKDCPPSSNRCFGNPCPDYTPGEKWTSVCGCNFNAKQGNCIGDLLIDEEHDTPYCLLTYGTYDNVNKCLDTAGNKWRFLKTHTERGSLLPANYLDGGSAVGQCCSSTDKTGMCATMSPSNCIDSSHTCEYQFGDIKYQLVGAPCPPSTAPQPGPPQPGPPQPGPGGGGGDPSGTTSSSKKLGAGAIIGIIIGVIFVLFVIITYYKYLKRNRVQFDFETLF